MVALARIVLFGLLVLSLARGDAPIVTPSPSIKSNKNASIPGIFPQVLPQPIPALEPITPQDTTNEPITKLEFLISYKVISQNGIITGEKYDISEPLVKKAQNLALDYTCTIHTPINDVITDDEDYAIKYVLQHYQDEILECLKKSGMNIRYDGLARDFTPVQDQTLLSLAPKRILAYFDNRYLIIEVLKDTQ